MNCNTCRFELSQCLDGRLPSGRRALVMQHVDECAGCARYWEEMQAAQALVLRLPSQRVGADFRDRLWARIEAGEGTPDAVFREPVPMLTKVRYALTGAAAAAAVLLAATWLRGERETPPSDAVRIAGAHQDQSPDAVVAEAGVAGAGVAGPGTLVRDARRDAATMNAETLSFVTPAQPLTADLVAVEAAKQLEQRHADVNWAIQRLRKAPEDHATLRRAFDSAGEFREFGTLLLTLRDRDRLSFRDSEVDADLRVAVSLLDERRLQLRDIDTLRSVVADAVRSDRLGRIARTIRVQPSIDPREEVDVLWRLSTLMPEVFPKLFFVMGSPDELCAEFGLPLRHDVFVLQGQCGPQWVARRSEVDRIEIRFQRSR